MIASTQPTEINIIDSSPGAFGRWSERCHSIEAISLSIHRSIPRDLDKDAAGVWVIVPESFTQPDDRDVLMDFAQGGHSRSEVMWLWNSHSVSPLAPTTGDAVCVDSREPERAIIRTLTLLVQSVRQAQALADALQFPTENPNPVFSMDSTGTVIFANPEAERILNLRDKAGDLVCDLVTAHATGTVSLVVDMPDQSFVFRLEYDTVAQRTHAYGIDLTESLASERQRLQLEQESQQKDQFLATMSHELRTPLNAILSCTEAMREGAYGPIAPNQLDAVQTIRESGKHLLCLITDILDISKIEAGQLELNTSTFGLQAVCDSVLEMVRSTASKKNISLNLDDHTDLKTLQGDPLRVKQILLNLLSNAIKFSPEYTEVGLRVLDGSEDGTIRFEVWDSGPGVDPSVASAVFKPFIQASGRYNRSEPGTGLGLAIARDLARLHDGDLTLESTPSGAVFSVILPVGDPVQEAIFDFRATGSWTLGETEETNRNDQNEIERVLIAEDTDSNFQHLNDLLVSLGYQVQRAMNGQEAVDLCDQIRPDLILMDIDMPVMNGLDAIRILREDPKTANLPIIAVTAMASVVDERACIEAGANGYLPKPYPLRDLMSLMQRVSA